jgi:hypothetical protein
MNDNELITAVKESVTGVHMHVPTEQIMRRSRAIRARRRIPGAAGALALVAGAALALTALLPASHQHGARLTAWTVAKQADGTIDVTIRELRDPAGLQSKLRADGVPASVTFSGQRNPSCRPYPAGKALLSKVFTPHQAPPGYTVIVIHPPALPRSTGVQLASAFGHHSRRGEGGLVAVGAGLVQASGQCTSS